MIKRQLTTSDTLTRVVIALVMGILIGHKTFWWSGTLVGAASLAFFLWAPRSGRNLMDSSGGATPMRLDERMRAIRDRAARDSLIFLMLALAVFALYFGFLRPGEVPLQLVMGVLGLGYLVYFVSDALRRQRVGG